jgi:hypothetical protein
MVFNPQTNTSMYGDFNRNRATIGDLLGNIQKGLTLYRDFKQTQEDAKANKAKNTINSAYGRNMTGFSGKVGDQDYKLRQQSAKDEILSSNPELYQYVQAVEDKGIDKQAGMLTLAKMQADGQAHNNKMVAEALQYVTTPEELTAAKSMLSKSGADVSFIPDDFAIYSKNPKIYVDWTAAKTAAAERQSQDIKTKQEAYAEQRRVETADKIKQYNQLSKDSKNPENILIQDPTSVENQQYVDKLNKFKEQNPYDQLQQFDLIGGAAFNDEAGKIVNTQLNEDKLKKLGGGSGAVWSQKKAMFDSDPDASKKLIGQIDALKNANLLTDISAQYFKERMTTDPISTSVALDEYISKPEIAAKIVTAQTAPKVAQEYALVPPKAAQAGANVAASGTAKAATPEFISERKAEWDKSTKDYNEAYQQYSMGKNAPNSATGDVAAINALEKVREINSAVMFGDFQKWQQAGSLWADVIQSGAWDAANNRVIQGRIAPEKMKDIQNLLDGLFTNRVDFMKTAQRRAAEVANKDYGWDAQRISRVYTLPKMGMESGVKPPPVNAKIESPGSAAAHPQASEAEKWAIANPNDPRSKEILKRLGK